jgi:type VI secretion system protein ImpH
LPRTPLERLASGPWQFEFFQAVRLLELAALYPPVRGRPATSGPVGQDYPPDRECLRFRVYSSQRFPGSEIIEYRPQPPGSASPCSTAGAERAEMTVSFTGLTGPGGALPQHYTQRLIDELLSDNGIRDFFDIFNHRLVSLFYRAWKKLRFPVSYETDSLARKRFSGMAIDTRETGDLFTFGLHCLIGKGTGGLLGRQILPDERFLFFGGLFAQYPPTAISLERMLVDYFGKPVEIVQFVGQWLRLVPSEMTRLSSGHGGMANNALGQNAIAGDRVWSIENRFRIRLGPLAWRDFCDFLPGICQLEPLGQFVRSYVGPEFDVEVQPVLRQEDVPVCQLVGDEPPLARLGWNTWLFSGSLGRDGDEAVFPVDGNPLCPAQH